MPSIAYLELCNENQIKELYKKCNATKESIERDVDTLIYWLEKHPYLPKIKDNDILENYLLRSENSLERAKTWLDIHYTARAEMPEIFENRIMTPEEIIKWRNFGSFIPVRKLTPEMDRIVIFSCPESLKKDVIPTQESLLKASQLSLDLSMKVDKMRSLIVIYDLGNISMSHATHLLPILKKMIALQTELNLLNIHKIYLVNLISVAEPLFHYCKGVIGKDLAKKIEIWKTGSSTLSEILPKECLPYEYGGTEKSIDELSGLWFDYCLEYKDWFEGDCNLKADLSKKPAGNKDASRMLSDVSGSFRKLCVD